MHYSRGSTTDRILHRERIFRLIDLDLEVKEVDMYIQRFVGSDKTCVCEYIFTLQEHTI
ncbi:hypothetical protein DEO72_LG4g1374 [Vigna unguiculata]|uniref:Uncharacterized protein n=1 Tax=Vigna unguiculata TaxID=3917 RepID=A0A4D6LNH7_VIGUN|nr:hypothetical protein DEO72_LG4g1374 [Vigna unguiculata]